MLIFVVARMYQVLLILAVLLWALPAHATYYWAAPSGSNTPTCSNIDSTDVATDPGSYGSINGAANCMTQPGDILLVKGNLGTYSGSNHQINTSIQTTGFASGSSEAVQSGIMGVPGEPIPLITTGNWFTTYDGSASYNRNYYFISGLKIDPSGNEGAGGAIIHIGGHHITVTNNELVNPTNVHIAAFRGAGSTRIHHLTISHNKLHGQASDGNGSCAYINADDVIVEYNECYDFKGQSAFQIFDAASGLTSDRAIIRYNYIHDIHKSTDGVHPGCGGMALDGANDLVYGNIIVGASECNNGISHGSGATGPVNVYHNIVTGFGGVAVSYGIFSTTTGNNIKNNIIINNGGTIANESNNGSTATLATNKTTGALTDCMTSSSTFVHKAGSSCINAGTAIAGFSFNGSAPDQGPFETFTCTGGTVTGNLMDVNCAMSLNTPILPSTNQTGWTVNNSRSVVTANRLTGSDAIVRIQFDGAACNAESWTFTQSGTTNVTDSALIGGTLNQPLLAISATAVTNNCGGTPPDPPTGPEIVYHLNDGSGTSVADASGNGNTGTTTGSPSWVTGSIDGALDFADGVDDFITAPWGSGLNPTSQSMTICLWVAPDSVLNERIYAGFPLGTNQRGYIGIVGGTWSIGVQSSFQGTNTEFPAQTTYALPCIVFDSVVDKATLWVNAVRGTTETGANGSSIKPYTSFTFSGNLTIGKANGFATAFSPGGVIDEVFVYEFALNQTEMTDLYQSLVNPPAPPTGTRKQKGHKFQRPYKSVTGAPEDIRDLNAEISLVLNGEVDWLVQTDHTGADPDPYGPRVNFSIDGGATYAQVNDLCGVICFRGESANVDLVTEAITGSCLVGILTCVLGPTNSTSAAVPNIDVAEDTSFMTRYKLRLGPNATEGQTIYLKLKDQNGNEFEDSAEPTSLGAKITVAGNTALNNTFLTSATQPQGFVELAGGTGRTRLTVEDIEAFMPTTRGAFTFPAPYGTQAARITDATDCSGSTDCVWYIGYSYWMNMNYHVNSTVIKIFVGLDNGDGGTGPNLFELNKSTMGVVKVGPIFGAASPWRNWSGESWYWSGSQENELYINDHDFLYRYNVDTEVFTEVIDVAAQFGANRELRQPHSTPDDTKHVYTLVDTADSDNPLGCVYYDETLDDATLYTKVGTYDECNITKDGRWTVITETITGAVDNRIFDNTNGEETRIDADNHALGHQDTGYNYTVGMDNDANIYSGFNTAITWVFADGGVGNPPNVIGPSGVRFWSSFDTQTNHISHTNAMPNLLAAQRMICGSNATDPGTFTQEDELTCFTLTSTLPQQAMIVAPLMTGLDADGGDIEYAKFPKGNLDITGKYFIWSTNLRGDRIDVFVTRVPPLLVP